MPEVLRLAIDVGGSNTDCVVLDAGGALLGKHKERTTADVTSGLVASVAGLLARHPDIMPADIAHIMIGSTHVMNALIERRDMTKVAAVRLSSDLKTAVRPLFGWPADLSDAVLHSCAVISGGHEIDGSPSVPLDEFALREFFLRARGRAGAVSITASFAPLDPSHEMAAAQIARDVLGPDLHISLSNQIGSVGLLERENATVLNAALSGVAQQMADSLRCALDELGLDHAEAFFSQNDGNLMALEYAFDYPVLTIGSGPANSLRGALYLTGLTDAIVVDIGGTTTDIGVLSSGFPRQSEAGAVIGGIATNFRMPDLISLGIGGGTAISDDAGDVVVGPGSVAKNLATEALVFGGSTATLTDAAVAEGRVDLGDLDVDRETRRILKSALEQAESAILEAADSISGGATNLPVVAVGGGSVLLSESYDGLRILRPDHHDVANAVGAAIGSMSGQIDRVFLLRDTTREAVLREAREAAINQAIRAGAHPAHVEIIELDEIPLSYLADPALRVRARAAGPLATSVARARTTHQLHDRKDAP